MIILQDSREQRPLTFPHEVEVHIEALPVGDYQVQLADGRVPPLALERKSVSDLWGTMTSQYPHFKAECTHAKYLGVSLILGIEATFSAVLRGYPRSAFAGTSMVRKLMTLWVRYGVFPMFCRNREELAHLTLALFEALEKNYAFPRVPGDQAWEWKGT